MRLSHDACFADRLGVLRVVGLQSVPRAGHLWTVCHRAVVRRAWPGHALGVHVLQLEPERLWYHGMSERLSRVSSRPCVYLKLYIWDRLKYSTQAKKLKAVANVPCDCF